MPLYPPPSSGSGGSGGAVWGGITGTLPNQTDLQGALNLKAPLASPAFSGTVTGVTKAMVGLGSVDNTADTSKPISAATQTALDAKADTIHAIEHTPIGIDPLKLDDLQVPDDNTDLNATSLKHGLLPKLSGIASNVFKGTGTFSDLGIGSITGLGINAVMGRGPIDTFPTSVIFGNGLQITGVAPASISVVPAQIKLDDLGASDDNTDLNASTLKHGLMQKYPGGTSNFLRSDGAFAAPTAQAGDPSYPTGSFTVETGTFRFNAKPLALAGSERMTIVGTGRYVGL